MSGDDGPGPDDEATAETAEESSSKPDERAPSTPATAGATGSVVGEVRSLSPLTIPYRIVRQGLGTLLTLAFLGVTGASMIGGAVGGAAVVGLLGVAVVALVGYEIARYRRYEYELTADSLDIRSGVFARRDREIPFRRIQNVDVTRSAVQRALGIAAVNVETAGGSDTEGVLRFVDAAEAARIQSEVARRKRRAAGAAEPEIEPEDELLFELSDAELALVGALSFDLRAPGALVLLLSGSLPSLVGRLEGVSPVFVALGVTGVLLAVFVGSWLLSGLATVVNYYGFRLTRVGDDLRYERGLFRRYDGTIPLEKVQTLTVEDNPLKRRFGYATLSVETAGYAPGANRDGGSQSATAVPLAERERLLALADDVRSFGDPDLNGPPRRVRRRYAVRYGLVVAGLTGLLYAVNRLVIDVPWYLALGLLPVVLALAHYVWRHRGYWLGPDHVVTRNGFFSRETKVVPYDRVQTVIDSRTLFQRRWRVATVTVDTAGSLSLTGQDAAAVDVDEAVAEDLREELVGRLRRALAGK